MATFLLHVFFALGGVSALIYEVVWMRSFRLVFGSSSRAAAVVLAAFLGGMAVGSMLGARWSQRGRAAVRYGCAELVTALSAPLVALWLALFTAAYPALYGALEGPSAPLTGVKLLLTALALAAPTIAMGATLPLVTRAVVTSPEHIRRRTGLLYASNVLGGVVGALLAGCVLPAIVGVRGTWTVAVGLNLSIGLLAILVGRNRPRADAEEVPSPTPFPEAESHPTAAFQPVVDARRLEGPRREGIGLLSGIAAASGSGTLALEVVFTRILSHQTEGSVYTFGLMLAVFMAFLAAGSAILSRWLDPAHPWRFLSRTQAAAAAMLFLIPILLRWSPVLVAFSPKDSFRAYLVKLGVVSVLSLGPAAFFMGALLPATWQVAGRSVALVGRRVGLLTAANTLAAVAGALLAGFVALPHLGLGRTLFSIGLLYLLVALLAHFRVRRGLRRWGAAFVCLGLVAGWYGLGFWQIEMQAIAPGEKLLAYRETDAASVAVVQVSSGHRVLKLNGEYVLGSSGAASREVGQGRLALLLHPDPKRVAYIGVATGMTVSATLDFPVERVVAVELIQGVADAVPYFEPWNRAVFDDPRVELVVDDGRSYLLGSRETFDVIASDLFVPWHSGTGDLYSVEHFESVRRRLAPGGLFALWLPGYQLGVEELRTLAATLTEVFPAAALWQLDFEPERPILGLIGYRDGLAIDPVRIEAACLRLAQGPGPPTPFLTSAAGVEMLYVWGDARLREWAAGARINSDDRPWIEFTTPASFYAHRQRPPLEMHALFLESRPRVWRYERQLSTGLPVEAVLEAADLLRASIIARLRNNFEREYDRLREVLALASDVPGVVEHVLAVAERYRGRQMTERSDALLTTLAERPDPPVAALLRLAAARQHEGRDAAAIDLLENALRRAPELVGARRSLVELLKAAKQPARTEAHLRLLIETDAEDPFLRLDLALALHEQGREVEAQREIEALKPLSGEDERKAIFRTLRSSGLGAYLASDAPRPATP